MNQPKNADNLESCSKEVSSYKVKEWGKILPFYGFFES